MLDRLKVEREKLEAANKEMADLPLVIEDILKQWTQRVGCGCGAL